MAKVKIDAHNQTTMLSNTNGMKLNPDNSIMNNRILI